MAVDKIPSWVETRNSTIVGAHLDVNQDGQFWSYVAGETFVPMSGAFTAAQLRDLDDMIDANQPFSLAGWAAWGGMIFECRPLGGFGLRHPRQHGAAVDGRWSSSRTFKRSFATGELDWLHGTFEPEPFSLAGWKRWASVGFMIHSSRFYVRGPDGWLDIDMAHRK